MKIAGHTMGTPDLSVPQAIDLFADIGLEGIEIICTDNYKSGITLETPDTPVSPLR